MRRDVSRRNHPQHVAASTASGKCLAQFRAQRPCDLLCPLVPPPSLPCMRAEDGWTCLDFASLPLGATKAFHMRQSRLGRSRGSSEGKRLTLRNSRPETMRKGVILPACTWYRAYTRAHQRHIAAKPRNHRTINVQWLTCLWIGLVQG